MTHSAPTTPADSGGIFADADRLPWPRFERLRREGDIVWDDEAEAWLVTSWELIREIGRNEGMDWEIFPIPGKGHSYPEGLDDDSFQWFAGLGSKRFISMDEGTPHDIQHRWWMRTFSPRTLRRWQDLHVRPIIRSELERFSDRGRADLISAYADRIPPRVLAALFGLPHDDWDFICRLESLFSRRLALKSRMMQRHVPQEVIDSAFDATRELEEILRDLILSRRGSTADDLISLIWRDAEAIFGEGWSDTDVLGVAVGMWEAGTGTTMWSTANGLYLLLTDGDARAAVECDPANASPLIEEALRLYGPVMWTRIRIALRDLDVGGVRITKGDRVLPVLAAGARDPRRFPWADSVDVERVNARSHLSFFAGRRTCVGQALARIELEDAIALLLERLPDVELDPDAPPPEFRGLTLRRWQPLNVRFTPAATGAGR